MSVAYDCCEAKRVTGRAEEKCACYNTLHRATPEVELEAPRERAAGREENYGLPDAIS